MPTTFPTIPRDEYPRRWAAVRQLMREQGLDALFAYADDHITYGPAWARYLADFTVHFEPVLLLFLPSGEPVMLVGPESPGYAQKRSAIQNIRVLREFTHPDEDYPYCAPESLRDIVADYAPVDQIQRIGIAGLGIIGQGLYGAMQAALPGEWIDMDDAMTRLRAVKTEGEIAVIRYAYRVARAGLDAAIEAVQPGVTERYIAAQAEHAMREMGSEGMGIDTIVATLANNSPILARTTMARVQRDDLVLLTLAPRYEGYHAALALPVVVGNPDKRALDALDAAIRAQRACAAMLRDGAGCEAEAEARRVMAEAGLKQAFQYSGIHSVGVIEFETPIFGPSCTETMRENMVLSIDIPVFGEAWGGLRIEDGYLIQAGGAQRLSTIEYLIKK